MDRTPGSANRVLSSRMTVFYKFVFLPVWIGGFAATTLGLFLFPHAATSPSAVPSPDTRWTFLGATIVGGLFLYWACGRLKKISISEDSIVISNYFRSARIPLVNVERVSGSRLMTPEIVWVVFDAPTPFGRQVVFMPPLRFTLGFNEHPIAAELRRNVEEVHHRSDARAEKGV